jgi:hypothetical protein
MKFKSILFFLFCSSYAIPAFSYIDPGSGSAIISAIIGGVVAVGMVIKTYWYKLKSLLSKKEASPENLENIESEKKQRSEP